MTRRSFLRFLGAAPIVGPAVIKALSLEPPARLAVDVLAPDSFAGEASAIVKRWATDVWVDIPRTVSWARYMSAGPTVDR